MNRSQRVVGADKNPTETTGIGQDVDRSDEDGAVRTGKPARLSVNISRDTVDALQEIAADKNISMTEAVRRLVGYGVVMYRANRDGYDVLLRRDGKLERIVLVN